MSNGKARNRVVLVVLDGWGYRREREGNAIELASTPVWHRLWESSPRTLLEASGLAVGLPDGQMGNSEVGHLNLGAGRVVPQDLVRISQSIQSGEFYQLKPLVDLCTGLRHSGGTLHLVGLLGPGGVHALDRHLLAANVEQPTRRPGGGDEADLPPHVLTRGQDLAHHRADGAGGADEGEGGPTHTHLWAHLPVPP